MNYTLEELKKIMETNDGSLYLRGTNITSLPEGLTVGGSLDLEGTNITSLPEGLTVGGSLYLRGTNITNKNHFEVLRDGDYKEGKYVYCDGILTHIKRVRKIGKYTYFYGKIKNKNVVYDGKHYAHCINFSEGVIDLEFKRMKNRGAEQYKNLTLESVLKKQDAIVMYRIITGACKAGTAHFIESLKETKEEYTVKEIIDLTKGQYGCSIFSKFFER